MSRIHVQPRTRWEPAPLARASWTRPRPNAAIAAVAWATISGGAFSSGVSDMRLVMAALELIAREPAIDRDDGAGDVVGERRGQEDREHREILGLAVGAKRDLLAGEFLALLRRIVAQDLLADDAAGRDRVDGDREPAGVTRQGLSTGV